MINKLIVILILILPINTLYANNNQQELNRLKDFVVAVQQDCMGWFCEKYKCGDLEFQAKNQMHLYRMVANELSVVKVKRVKSESGFETEIRQLREENQKLKQILKDHNIKYR